MPDLTQLVPAKVHIAALRLAHAVRRRWWRLTGVTVKGCRVVVLDGEGRVLLIRHSYGSGHWMLPGGGIKRGEAPVTAAAREVREEAGIALVDPVAIGTASETLGGVRHEVRLIAGWTSAGPIPDGREVIEAKFHAVGNLPPHTAGRLPDLLSGYVTAATAARPRSAG